MGSNCQLLLSCWYQTHFLMNLFFLLLAIHWVLTVVQHLNQKMLLLSELQIFCFIYICYICKVLSSCKLFEPQPQVMSMLSLTRGQDPGLGIMSSDSTKNSPLLCILQCKASQLAKWYNPSYASLIFFIPCQLQLPTRQV